MKRDDDYQVRRQSVANLSDKELEQRFCAARRDYIASRFSRMNPRQLEAVLTTEGPLVLLRMGFSSIEAKAIADGCVERNLLGHGAGNVVYRLAKAKEMDYIDAGKALCEGRLWDEAAAQF